MRQLKNPYAPVMAFRGEYTPPSQVKALIQRTSATTEEEYISLEALYPLIWSPNLPGVFPATIATLAQEGKKDEALRLLDWIVTQRGPFEAQIPQCRREGLLGIFALSQHFEGHAPKGSWEKILADAWCNFTPDPQQTTILEPFHALITDSGPCGNWLREATTKALLSIFEERKTAAVANNKAMNVAVALLSTLLPILQTHPQIFDTLRAQMRPEHWHKVLIRSQLLFRQPVPGLKEELESQEENTSDLAPCWTPFLFRAKTTAAPNQADMEAIKGDFLGGCGPWTFLEPYAQGTASEALIAVAKEILSLPKHPRGGVALKLLQTWQVSLPNVKNHRAKAYLGDANALRLLLEESPFNQLAARHLAYELGQAGAQHPAIATALIDQINTGTQGLAASVELARAFWWQQAQGFKLPQKQVDLQLRLQDISTLGVKYGGNKAFQSGQMLGFSNQNNNSAHRDILGLISRTPGRFRHRLLEPLGACGSADEESFHTLTTAIGSPSHSIRLGGLRGLGRMAQTPRGSALLKNNWQKLHLFIQSIDPIIGRHLGAPWHDELWHLSRLA